MATTAATNSYTRIKNVNVQAAKLTITGDPSVSRGSIFLLETEYQIYRTVEDGYYILLSGEMVKEGDFLVREILTVGYGEVYSMSSTDFYYNFQQNS